MCPACIANAALIATGAVSAGAAGGWTAFALRKPRTPRGETKAGDPSPAAQIKSPASPSQPTDDRH